MESSPNDNHNRGDDNQRERTLRSNNDDQATEREPPASPTSSPSSNDNHSNSHHRQELGIFERFMDNVLGINRNSNSNRSGNSVNSSESSNSTNNPDFTTTTTANTSTTTSTSSELNNNGAIIITVNYVFSDENNPQNPNRSGSLVMTLPNNPSNRDPRVIQEFIRLATQMAYSTIVSGLNKEKGITIEKFNTFSLKDVEDLNEESKTCSICFEKFEHIKSKRRTIDDSDEGKRSNDEIDDDKIKDATVSTKKRKLNNNKSETTRTSTNERTTNSDENISNTNENNTSRPAKYLSEFIGTFKHLPVQMPCGHIFGKSCLFEWLKDHTTCPLCRDSVGEPHQNNNNQRSGPTIFGLNNNNNSNNNNSNNSNIINNNNNDNTNQRQNFTIIDRSDRFSELLENLNATSRGPLRRVLRSSSGSSSISGDNLPSNRSNEESEPYSNQRESNVLSHILTYLRRPQSNNNTESLFPTGVTSRRTASGVETRSADRTDSDDTVVDYMNLRSLVDDSNNENNSSSNDNSSNNNNENDNNNDNENGTG